MTTCQKAGARAIKTEQRKARTAAFEAAAADLNRQNHPLNGERFQLIESPIKRLRRHRLMPLLRTPFMLENISIRIHS
jgi:hypothetical protein